eukprot:5905599-Alexandrium_andersonii.AAC.1
MGACHPDATQSIQIHVDDQHDILAERSKARGDLSAELPTKSSLCEESLPAFPRAVAVRNAQRRQ